MHQAEASPIAPDAPTASLPVMADLANRLRCGPFHIGIYGLGYVGLPLALRFVEMGIRVTGFDIDPHKIETLNSGHSYIERVTPAEIDSALRAGFSATTDFSHTSELDAQIICVPTPLDRQHQPDLSFVINTVESILPYFRDGQLLSLESTTWLGTTEKLIEPRLRDRGFLPGHNCALGYSPESAAVEIMSLLEDKGTDIAYSDPHVPGFPRKRDYQIELASIPLIVDNIPEFDCIVIATDHDAFGYELLLAHGQMIVDTRGRLSGYSNVVSA